MIQLVQLSSYLTCVLVGSIQTTKFSTRRLFGKWLTFTSHIPINCLNAERLLGEVLYILCKHKAQAKQWMGDHKNIWWVFTHNNWFNRLLKSFRFSSFLTQKVREPTAQKKDIEAAWRRLFDIPAAATILENKSELMFLNCTYLRLNMSISLLCWYWITFIV